MAGGLSDGEKTICAQGINVHAILPTRLMAGTNRKFGGICFVYFLFLFFQVLKESITVAWKNLKRKRKRCYDYYLDFQTTFFETNCMVN